MGQLNTLKNVRMIHVGDFTVPRCDQTLIERAARKKEGSSRFNEYVRELVGDLTYLIDSPDFKGEALIKYKFRDGDDYETRVAAAKRTVEIFASAGFLACEWHKIGESAWDCLLAAFFDKYSTVYTIAVRIP